jgi:hypothetical protein
MQEILTAEGIVIRKYEYVTHIICRKYEYITHVLCRKYEYITHVLCYHIKKINLEDNISTEDDVDTAIYLNNKLSVKIVYQWQ